MDRITYARERMENYGSRDGHLKSWWDERIENLETQLTAAVQDRDALKRLAYRERRQHDALRKSSFGMACGFCVVVALLAWWILRLKGWA